MSGSDQDLIKDLEEDVVETQGTVRYKQAANTQDQDDIELEFEEYYTDDEEAVAATTVQQGGVASGTGDIEEDYWVEEEVIETEDGVRVVRHKLAQKQKKADDSEEETKQAGGTIRHKISRNAEQDKPRTNLVVKMLEKNPLGMTLPEMAGGVRKQKRIKTLRPMLAQAIKEGLIMPVSQRAGYTVYKLVKNIGPR